MDLVRDRAVVTGVATSVVFAVLVAVIAPFRRWLVDLFRWMTTRFGVSGSIQIAMDEQFPHVPWITITVHNRSARSVVVTTVEFTTKASWELVDPRREGVTADVLRFIDRDLGYVLISNTPGSVAPFPLNATVPAFGTVTFRTRLLTHHSPGYAMGVFPYHLGVTLKWSQGKTRKLQDILVSLHGRTPMSQIEGLRIAQTEPDTSVQSANAALSAIAEGAQAVPEVRQALERIARVPQARARGLEGTRRG